MKEAKATELEARLGRLEAKVERVLALLEARTSGTALQAAVGEASRALEGALGADETRARVATLLTRLAEPETSESLVRVAELAPHLELALHAVAAAPALLEEASDLARRRLAWLADPALSERRLRGALELVERLAREDGLEGLAELADLVPAIAPLARGARAGLELRLGAEGASGMAEQVAELVVRLSDPEITAALTRIAGLAPDLEYAAHFAAAGPALLEEGLELLRTQARREGLELDANRAMDLARSLASPSVLAALARLAAAAPVLTPVAAGAARALAAHQGVEGAASLEARVAEAVQEILHPETLDALVRIAQLTPQIEYAVQALAAGPALLEEGLDTVRKWSGRNLDGASLEARVEKAMDLLVTLSEPRRLAALERIVGRVEALAPIAEAASGLDHAAVAGLLGALGNPRTADGVRRLMELAPTIAPPLEALPIQAGTLEVLRTLNQAVDEAGREGAEIGVLGLLSALGDRQVRRAAGFGIGVARRLGRRLEGPPALPSGARNGHAG